MNGEGEFAPGEPGSAVGAAGRGGGAATGPGVAGGRAGREGVPAGTGPEVPGAPAHRRGVAEGTGGAATGPEVEAPGRAEDPEEAGAEPGRVAIVGAGQVGTMLGMALRAAGAAHGVRSVGLLDRDPAVAAASLERGAGDRVLSGPGEAAEADTLILALPVPAVLEFLQEHGGRLREGSLVIDTGSAKRAVVEAMRRWVPSSVHALGGHPMAGTEVPGPAGARPEVLRDAPFALTPVREDPEALARGRRLARAVGARPVVVDAERHDRTVARTSHLPHLVAYAVAAVARDAFAAGGLPALASTGLASATRLAASDPTMVAGFLWANAGEVEASVEELVARLGRFRAALTDGPEPLAELLAAARAGPVRTG